MIGHSEVRMNFAFKLEIIKRWWNATGNLNNIIKIPLTAAFSNMGFRICLQQKNIYFAFE
jgi:hypothetical protein